MTRTPSPGRACITAVQAGVPLEQDASASSPGGDVTLTASSEQPLHDLTSRSGDAKALPRGDGAVATCAGDPADVYEDVQFHFSSARHDGACSHYVDLGRGEYVPLRAVGEGSTRTTVQTSADGTDQQFDTVVYDDIVLVIDSLEGLNASPSLTAWVERSVTLGETRLLSGTVFSPDPATGRARDLLRFDDAVLTGFTPSGLSASCNEAGWLALRLVPKLTREVLADRIAPSVPNSLRSGVARWMSSDFRVELGRLPTDRVTQVTTLSLQGDMSVQPSLDKLTPRTVSSHFQVSDVTLTISATDVDPWADWSYRILIEGNLNELSGSIAILDQALSGELMRFELRDVGLVALEATPPSVDSDRLASFETTLYIEKVEAYF